jgi:hypothetical protein
VHHDDLIAQPQSIRLALGSRTTPISCRAAHDVSPAQEERNVVNRQGLGKVEPLRSIQSFVDYAASRMTAVRTGGIVPFCRNTVISSTRTGFEK